MKSILTLSFALLLTTAAAAPVKITTTPEFVYLFVVVIAPSQGRVPFEELYQSTDKAACESQAKKWSETLAPIKFACLEHAQKKLDAVGYPD